MNPVPYTFDMQNLYIAEGKIGSKFLLLKVSSQCTKQSLEMRKMYLLLGNILHARTCLEDSFS